jgi:hypothetical protein
MRRGVTKTSNFVAEIYSADPFAPNRLAHPERPRSRRLPHREDGSDRGHRGGSNTQDTSAAVRIGHRGQDSFGTSTRARTGVASTFPRESEALRGPGDYPVTGKVVRAARHIMCRHIDVGQCPECAVDGYIALFLCEYPQNNRGQVFVQTPYWPAQSSSPFNSDVATAADWGTRSSIGSRAASSFRGVSWSRCTCPSFWSSQP